MNKKLKIFTTTFATAIIIGSVIPIKFVYASEDNGDTLNEFKSAIYAQIDKINVTNGTTEGDFDDEIQRVVKKYEGSFADIEDFNRDKATRDDSGQISFNVNITDSDGDDTEISVSRTIPRLETHVYLKLPEFKGKYLNVLDENIIKLAKNGELDNSKYNIYSGLYDSDELVKLGWNTIDKSTYYIDNSGVKKGWQEIDGSLYHFEDDTGRLKAGWELYNNKWYYSGEDGSVLTGLKKINNKTYYFNKKPEMQIQQVLSLPNWGDMATGWVKIYSSWYFFNPDGSMQLGWKQVGDKWYYFNTDGSMAYNTKIDGYELDKDGALL